MATTKYEVHKIYTTEVKGNSHTVGRYETWNYCRVKKFDTLEEAQEYADQQNCELLDYKRMAPREENMREEFRKRYLTEDRYVKYKRYFVGNPPMALIAKYLVKDGIEVLDLRGFPYERDE